MKDLTLVVMAAGMGSRFGGLKQITPVDADDNFIIDYSVYDAIRAGFTKIVFVIKEETYDIFKETIGNRVSSKIKVEYAFQRKEDIPANKLHLVEKREKPWGTAQAILAARPYVAGNFAVVNADDFYGADCYKKLAKFFDEEHDDNTYVTIGYRFCDTSSSAGKVKRGVFDLNKENHTINTLIESSVGYDNDKLMAAPLDGREPFEIEDTQLVSMNVFGFNNSFFDLLQVYQDEFFSKDDEFILNNEVLLPFCLEENLNAGKIVIKYETSANRWLGMTYKEDLDIVKEELSKMKENGEYPISLWK